MNKGNYHYSYQRSALQLISEYDFSLPFSVYLKGQFKRHKKFGSKDRKTIADLCYGYLRLGESAGTLDHDLQMVMGYFLTHQQDNGYLDSIKPEWLPYLQQSISSKLHYLQENLSGFHPKNIFPNIKECSDGLSTDELAQRMLLQPEVHLRIRKGKRETVLNKLRNAALDYQQLSETVIAIQGNPNLEEILKLDEECVVQDISSQLTMMPLNCIQEEIVSIWDACAGSGGKAIQVHDRFPNAKLFVSDIREQILEELKRRFQLASIRNAKMFCNDLEHPMSSSVIRSNLPSGGVDLVIADVPCTGSGTWSRSPEWLRAFDLQSISEYQSRQQRIMQNVIPHVKSTGGYLLYITCSVYKAENEDMVSFILEHSKLKLLQTENINGINGKGDFLFAALFSS